ncbi:mediator of RNA polymerase II transcription subunit 28 [Aplysia californica]|uniref:Mediator of RNA polymerase II transcription subunit 28 n=1 Tax=Aplysia californica TaxID=6500 RepID=A0ABM0JN33_APLCA|nr:mediator of RNA polymerase II transcription subunit 28 [Aplysia californica]
MATSSDGVSGTSPHLVDDFESAFQNCISLLTSQEHFNVQDPEETKGGVENSVQRFLESARQMETFFLNKRLVLSVAKPEHVLNEDITELRTELERKDKLIEKHHEKLQKWQALLRSNAPPPSTTPSSPFPGTQTQAHQTMATGPSMPQTTPSGPQMSGPQSSQGMMGQQVGSMAPGQYPGPPAGHPGQYNMPPPAYHQGPLAFLERM